MSEQPIKNNQRNSYGVKASTELYRTIKGAHYICWLSYPSDERIAAYRAAGIRCARRGVEFFIHHMDQDDAVALERKLERPRKERT